MVSSAVTTQVMIIRPGDWTWREISAETMKIPEPIMDPITSVVESSRPSPFTRVVGVAVLVVCIGQLHPFLRSCADRGSSTFMRVKIADDGDGNGSGIQGLPGIWSGDTAHR